MLDLPPEAYPIGVEMIDEEGRTVAFWLEDDPDSPAPDPRDFHGAKSLQLTFANPVPFL